MESHNITIKIRNELIQKVSYTKILGVLIDENLTWKNHIDSICKTILKFTGLISKLRHFTNLNTIKLTYYALIYPYLTYGNLAWGNTYPSKIEKLFRIQKKIIRLMKFKSYTEHTKPLFNDLKILNIFKINDYLTSLFMYRCNYTNDLPDIFNGYFIKNSNIYEHCTRNSKKLHKVYTRTNYRKQSVVSKGIDIWNNLSTELKNIGSSMVFKKNVKTYFISHQSAN